jgi:hypothetical protein
VPWSQASAALIQLLNFFLGSPDQQADYGMSPALGAPMLIQPKAMSQAIALHALRLHQRYIMVPYMRGLLQPLFPDVFSAAAIMQVRIRYIRRALPARKG